MIINSIQFYNEVYKNLMWRYTKPEFGGSRDFNKVTTKEELSALKQFEEWKYLAMFKYMWE